MTAAKGGQHTAGPTAYTVKRSDGMTIGIVNYTEWSGGRKGWRFFPQFQADISRKLWSTPEAALKGRVTDYTLVPPIARNAAVQNALPSAGPGAAGRRG